MSSPKLQSKLPRNYDIVVSVIERWWKCTFEQCYWTLMIPQSLTNTTCTIQWFLESCFLSNDNKMLAMWAIIFFISNYYKNLFRLKKVNHMNRLIVYFWITH